MAMWRKISDLLDEGLVEEVERIRRRHRHRQYIIRSTQLLISLNGPSIKLRVGIFARHRNCNEIAERVCVCERVAVLRITIS